MVSSSISKAFDSLMFEPVEVSRGRELFRETKATDPDARPS